MNGISSASGQALCIVVPEACDGLRLDRALLACVHMLPDDAPRGLRGWKRACELGHVSIRGRIVSVGYRVKAGQSIHIRDFGAQEEETNPPEPYSVVQADSYVAVYKPAGWHSVRLAGSGGRSVETWLESQKGRSGLILLNRLDYGTSGLVLCARTRSGEENWRQAESSGLVHKYYLAVVEGKLGNPLFLRAALDTDKRTRTRVLIHEGDLVRSTRAVPLTCLSANTISKLFPEVPETDATLVLCRIEKGARHQIRAHLAHAGFPLLGDALYGSRCETAMLLHHACMDMPGFHADCRPVWADALDEELPAAAGFAARFHD